MNGNENSICNWSACFVCMFVVFVVVIVYYSLWSISVMDFMPLPSYNTHRLPNCYGLFFDRSIL